MAITWIILESLCGLLCGGLVAALILGLKAAGGQFLSLIHISEPTRPY